VPGGGCERRSDVKEKQRLGGRSTGVWRRTFRIARMCLGVRCNAAHARSHGVEQSYVKLFWMPFFRLVVCIGQGPGPRHSHTLLFWIGQGLGPCHSWACSIANP